MSNHHRTNQDGFIKRELSASFNGIKPAFASSVEECKAYHWQGSVLIK